MQVINEGSRQLTAAEVLRAYKEEDLPEFVELPLDGVNQVGNFGNYPIHVAATRGNVDELRALIEGGADVNATGEHGNTPLHEAVRQEQTAAIQLLLACGARPTDKNGWGQTALDIARIYKRNDLLELLGGAS